MLRTEDNVTFHNNIQIFFCNVQTVSISLIGISEHSIFFFLNAVLAA